MANAPNQTMAPKPTPGAGKPRKKNEHQAVLRDEKKREEDLREWSRRIMGLKDGQPSPTPQMDEELEDALDELPEQDQQTFMTVLGCTQEISRQIEAANRAAQQEAGASQAKSSQTSLAQLLTIRRADHGNLTDQDVERARGIIQGQGARGRIDPVTSGASSLLHKGQEMLMANRALIERLPRLAQAGVSFDAIETITEATERNSSHLEQSRNDFQATMANTDLERLRQIVAGRDVVARTAGSRPETAM